MSTLMRSIAEFFSLWRFSRIAFLIVVVLLSVGVWKLFFSHNKNAANYVTTTVERSDIKNLVTAMGILQPRDYVDVGAQVSGQLKKLVVVVGQQVKAGDLLAEIDATVYRAKVDGIRAQLHNQQAQLGDKKAQLVLANIRLERQQNLFKDDATTKDSLQTAEASAESATALLKALDAQIEQTESSLRAEEANLAYARIYAPISGTVVSITSRQGQTLNANQQAPTIMRIADLSVMTVQTQVSEADIGKLQVGMPVYFTTLGGQDYRWYSKLDRIEPTPEVTNNVVLYNALFDVPNDRNVLMTKMSTQVFFIAAQAKDTLVIPASALNFKPRNPGDSGDKQWADKKSGTGQESNWRERKQQVEPSPAPKDLSDEKKESLVKSVSRNKSSEAVLNENKNGDASEQGNEKYKHKNWKPRAIPIAGVETQPRTASVQLMNSKGNLSEKNIIIGISNRVKVQVLEGLQEGEVVVSGMRQFEKPSTAAGSQMAPSAPGGGARQLR